MSHGMEEEDEQKREGRKPRKDSLQLLLESDRHFKALRHAMGLAEADSSSSSFGSFHMFNLDDPDGDTEMRKMQVAARKDNESDEPQREEFSLRHAGHAVAFDDMHAEDSDAPQLSFPRFKTGRLVGAPLQALTREESTPSYSSVESLNIADVDDLVNEETGTDMEMQEAPRRKKETGEPRWEESAHRRARKKNKKNEERQEPGDSSSENSIENICDEDS